MRKLIAAAVLAGGLVVVGGSAAYADPGKTFNKELAECVHDALHDNGLAENVDKGTAAEYKDFANALEDCKKAPSLLTPALSEIIWGAIAFAIVAFMLMKFAFPALKKTMKAREERIRSDLESAEQAREEARAEKARYEQQLSEGRAEAHRIVEQAREDAERVRTDLTARAETEAAEIRSRAQEDMRLVSERAMSDLQGRVTDLSIELAEKIVEHNLDHDTQTALVESYISSVGSGNGGS
jgi:F-type H+-transporting ATPase subunit b